MTSSQTPDKDPSSETSSWAYASLGMQIVVTVLVFIYIGIRVDRHWQTKPWGFLSGAVVGILVGLYSFIKTVSQIKQ
jgi:F0F1-type ATP synthase assembly protein I